jgi:succinoglycan biosynthesis transport protein ExoP
LKPSESDSQQTDFVRIVAVLRRRIGLIALCIVIAAAAAAGISLIQEKEYSTTASLLFRSPAANQDVFGSDSAAPVTSPTREAATNEKLVGLDIVAERTARKIGGMTGPQVSSMISVFGEGEADIVSISAKSSEPAQAKRVANEFAREFIAFRTDAERSTLVQAKEKAEHEFNRLPPDEQSGVRGSALSSAAERLGILASLQTGNAELVQPAGLPATPSSPKPLRNTILGALLGLLLGIALAFLFERFNRQIREPEEAREVFGLPVLGTVPDSKAIIAANGGVTAAELPFVENEAFRTLRASLRYFNIDHEIRTVLVTSHDAEAGKSTVTWNLARVTATSAKVVIVETDLRNPSLARQHALKVGPGLAEVLTHQVDLDEAIQHKSIATQANGSSAIGNTLDIIVAGSMPPNPAELIESTAMEEALSQLTERYDLVVIDTAPLGVVSDAFSLLRHVDGVIVVTRMEKSTRDAAEHMREQLERLEAPVLGIVANGVKRRRGGKGAYGYYGYYGRGSDSAGQQNSDDAVSAPSSESPRPPASGSPR